MASFTTTIIGKIVFDLTTLQRFKYGDIIDTTSDYINISQPSIKKSIDRSLNGDNRNRALSRCNHIIDSAFEFAERILESKYLTLYTNATFDGRYHIEKDQLDAYEIRMHWLMQLSTALSAILPALELFKQTYEYKYDSTISGKCVELINSTATRSNDLKARIDGLKFDASEYKSAVAQI